MEGGDAGNVLERKIDDKSETDDPASKKVSESELVLPPSDDIDDAKVTPKEPKRKPLPVIDWPWTRLLPKNKDVDFETYLRLKREERQMIRQHHAAAIIQAAWCGFVVRFNLRIVVDAITKIQAGVRAHRAKGRSTLLAQERKEKKLTARLNKAAVKIQAAWRGYWSRKAKLDYASWKQIQLKNEALKQSIERINELEALLLQSQQEAAARESTSTQKTSKKSSKKSQNPCEDSFSLEFDHLSPSLENMIIDKLPELVNEMSEDRIAELYTYLANLEMELKTERQLERKVEKLGGIHNLNEEQLYTLEQSRKKQKQRAQLILDLAKLGMEGTLKSRYLPRERDSVDEMFPAIPERKDLVHPDLRKVEDLKRAIRLFRKRQHQMADSELKKKHPLLRTASIPGVFSDIYTTDLTDFEKRIKSMKFWKGSIIEDKKREKEQAGLAAKDQRLRTLFTHAIRISAKASPSPSPPPSNDGTADDELEYTEMTGETMDFGNEEEFESYADSGGQGEYVGQPLNPESPIPPPPTPTETEATDDF